MLLCKALGEDRDHRIGRADYTHKAVERRCARCSRTETGKVYTYKFGHLYDSVHGCIHYAGQLRRVDASRKKVRKNQVLYYLIGRLDFIKHAGHIRENGYGAVQDEGPGSF